MGDDYKLLLEALEASSDCLLGWAVAKLVQSGTSVRYLARNMVTHVIQSSAKDHMHLKSLYSMIDCWYVIMMFIFTGVLV